jgi:hypothetical protein
MFFYSYSIIFLIINNIKNSGKCNSNIKFYILFKVNQILEKSFHKLNLVTFKNYSGNHIKSMLLILI